LFENIDQPTQIQTTNNKKKNMWCYTWKGEKENKKEEFYNLDCKKNATAPNPPAIPNEVINLFGA